jgi:DNA polymerase-3 subunit gamma/tau
LYHAASFSPLRWRKKKGSLIPTHKLKYTESNTKQVSTPIATNSEYNISQPKTILKEEPPKQVPAPPPIVKPEIKDINLQNNQVSSLSLSSIKKKKEWEQKQKPVQEIEEKPVNAFTEEELRGFWESYKNKKFESGDQNIASLLNISKPHLEGSAIQFSVPSDMNKVELEREFTEFVPYLRTSLQNHDLSIKVIVDEKTEKNFIYTADEKYERLKEINPMIDLLRQEFDLDV